MLMVSVSKVNLVCQRWRCGHVAVHSCPVHRGTVGTVEETCDWALTVTSRSLWTTSAQPWCRLFPLHWQRGPSKADRQVLWSWRPISPAGTRSWLVWRSYVTTGCRSLKNILIVRVILFYSTYLTREIHVLGGPQGVQKENHQCCWRQHVTCVHMCVCKYLAHWLPLIVRTHTQIHIQHHWH